MRTRILLALMLALLVAGCVGGRGPARPTTVTNDVSGDCVQISGSYKGFKNYCRRGEKIKQPCPVDQLAAADRVRAASKPLCDNPVNSAANRSKTKGWLAELRSLTGRK